MSQVNKFVKMDFCVTALHQKHFLSSLYLNDQDFNRFLNCAKKPGRNKHLHLMLN